MTEREMKTSEKGENKKKAQKNEMRNLNTLQMNGNYLKSSKRFLSELFHLFMGQINRRL
jgi:hypothetical protein